MSEIMLFEMMITVGGAILLRLSATGTIRAAGGGWKAGAFSSQMIIRWGEWETPRVMNEFERQFGFIFRQMKCRTKQRVTGGISLNLFHSILLLILCNCMETDGETRESLHDLDIRSKIRYHNHEYKMDCRFLARRSRAPTVTSKELQLQGVEINCWLILLIQWRGRKTNWSLFLRPVNL